MHEKPCCPFCAGMAIGERFARIEQRLDALEKPGGMTPEEVNAATKKLVELDAKLTGLIEAPK